MDTIALRPRKASEIIDAAIEVYRRNPIHFLLLAAMVRVPWLIVHGSDDETVPFSEAERLASIAGANAELLVLDGVNHSFGGKHPLGEITPTLESITRRTVEFFAKSLSSPAV